ncbi:hypothetical protein SNEBB_006299 [Seison nebaliae]|nr:hypothetical protein SNEBB_006299 [Seison nebaliae]
MFLILVVSLLVFRNAKCADKDDEDTILLKREIFTNTDAYEQQVQVRREYNERFAGLTSLNRNGLTDREVRENEHNSVVLRVVQITPHIGIFDSELMASIVGKLFLDFRNVLYGNMHDFNGRPMCTIMIQYRYTNMVCFNPVEKTIRGYSLHGNDIEPFVKQLTFIYCLQMVYFEEMADTDCAFTMYLEKDNIAITAKNANNVMNSVAMDFIRTAYYSAVDLTAALDMKGFTREMSQLSTSSDTTLREEKTEIQGKVYEPIEVFQYMGPDGVPAMLDNVKEKAPTRPTQTQIPTTTTKLENVLLTAGTKRSSTGVDPTPNKTFETYVPPPPEETTKKSKEEGTTTTTTTS